MTINYYFKYYHHYDGGGSIMRVLVYENTQDRAKLIEDLLNTYRYKIFVNGDQAPSLNHLKDIKPSLLIVNVNNQSHLEFLEKMKSHSQFSKIPVIMLSNINSFETFQKFHQMPHVDYLVEPFKIKNFRHIVERWINFKSLYVN
jgi:DNA-binding response OmpR family regulator